MKTTLLICAMLLPAAPPLAASQITSLWNGGTGDWTDPLQWTPNGIPNNGADSYLVTINSGGIDTVNLFRQTVFLDGFTAGLQATVNVNDQGLELGNASSSSVLLTNAGNLNFTNAANLTLDFSGGASASSSGAISLGDESEIFMQTSVTGGGGTLTNTGSISLQNNPHGSQIYLMGDGATFGINGGGTLTLSDNAANLITGTFGTENLVTDNRLSGAGTISNLTTFTNNGSVVANGTNPLIFNMDYSTGGTNLTGMITNNGSMSVANASTLTFQGGNGPFSVVNNGTIALNSTGLITQLVYNDNGNHQTLFLSGSGTLSLSDGGGNFLEGANGDETLQNQLHHTITGAGIIAGFGGGIVNNGTIVANGVNALAVAINDATSAGKPGITNNGLIQVNDGGTLEILSNTGGTILNAGAITLNAKNFTSTLSFDDFGSGGVSGPPGTVLQISGGALTLSDNPGNRIAGVTGDEGLQINAGTTLSGAGTITNFGGYEGLTNEGTILANGHNPLILDGTAASAALHSSSTVCGCVFSALSNFGLVQVNDGSTFEIRSDIGASIHNWSGFAGPGGGVITLNALASTSTLAFDSLGKAAFFTFDGNGPGTPGLLQLSDNPGNQILGVSGAEGLYNGPYHTIEGAGTINLAHLLNQGNIIASGSNPLIFESPTILLEGFNNQGLVQVNDGSTFEFRATQAGQTSIFNQGSITLNAGVSTSTLAFNNQNIAGTIFFLNSSGGTITLTDNPGNRIVGVTGTETLSLFGGTLQGAGTIGNFGGGLTNDGTIIAKGVNPLIVDMTAATNLGNPGLVNAGTLQVSDGGTLQFRSGAGGTVVADGAFLLNSSVGTSTLSFNDLDKGQTFTLAGTGLLSLSNGPGNRIMGVNGDETLINGSGVTIDGRGVISNFAQFTNNGTLSADKVTLEVQAPLGNWNAATATLSGGTYNAYNGGAVKLDSIGGSTLTNLNGVTISDYSGGTVAGNGTANILGGLANMTNSTVTLDSLPAPLTIAPNGSNTLSLTNSNLAIVSFTSANTVTLNGNYFQDANSTLDLGAVSGPATPTPQSQFVIFGNFTNQGFATIGNTVGPGALEVAGTLLANSGTLQIGDSSFVAVYGVAGTTGSNVQNQGTINLLGSGAIYFLDTLQGQTFTLSGSGTLNLEGAGTSIQGFFKDEKLINYSSIVGAGTISNFAQFNNQGLLASAGGTLEVAAPLANWDAASGTLTDGSYAAILGGNVRLDSIGANVITNLVGVGITNGDNGIISGNGALNALSGLTHLTNSSVLFFTLSSPLTITPSDLHTLDLTNSELAFTSGGSITVHGNYSQDANSILALGVNTGTTVLLPTSTFVTTGNFTNQGAVVVGEALGPATLIVEASINNSGSFQVGAGSNMVETPDFFNSGSVDIQSGAEIVAFLGNYIQTAGITKVETGGTLSASNIDLEGGTLGGGGTIAGNVDVTGGIFAPGDPMTTEHPGRLHARTWGRTADHHRGNRVGRVRHAGHNRQSAPERRHAGHRFHRRFPS